MSRMYTSPAAGERESGRDTNARARRGRVAGAGGARCGSEGTGLADGGPAGAQPPRRRSLDDSEFSDAGR